MDILKHLSIEGNITQFENSCPIGHSMSCKLPFMSITWCVSAYLYRQVISVQAQMYEHNCSYIFYARIYGEHRMDEKKYKTSKESGTFYPEGWSCLWKRDRYQKKTLGRNPR